MHMGSDAIDRTGTSESNAGILRRGTLRQPSPFAQRIKDQSHLAARPPARPPALDRISIRVIREDLVKFRDCPVVVGYDNTRMHLS